MSKKATKKTSKSSATSKASKSSKTANTNTSNNPNTLIIGIPLIVAAVFSFSFISMYPNKVNAPVSKVEDNSSNQSSASTLPPIAISSASFQKLSPLNAPTPTESQPASPTAGVAATSQNPQESPDNTVAAGRDQIQSAVQTKNLYNIKIKVPKPEPVQSRSSY